MAQHETVLDVGDTFSPGSQVEVHPRVADTLSGPPITDAVKKVKVRNDGTVRVKGLEPHGPYFLTGTIQRPEPQPGAGAKDKMVERFASFRFDAAGPLPSADDDSLNTLETANKVADAQREARAKTVANTPSGAGGTGQTGRQFTRSGAIDTNQPSGEQVGAENRPGEAREVGADGVEDRPKEARRAQRARGARKNQSAAKVKAKPRQRKAGKPLSTGRPSR